MKPYVLKIREGCRGGGKGPLIQEDKAMTLSTLQDQYLFQPIAIENHPADSRVDIDTSGTCQTLTSRMGTGGGNVPMIIEVYGISSDKSNAVLSDNPKSGIYKAETSRTLDVNGGNPACNQGGMVVIEGNGSRPSHKGDGYKESDISYTLNSTEQHCIAYATGNGQADQMNLSDKSGALDCMHDQKIVVIDRAAFNQGENAKYDMGIDADGGGITTGNCKRSGCCVLQETVGAICARDYKGVGNQYVQEGKCIVELKDNDYIVRRYTPTECARLQGFPSWWGEIDPKDDFTDEEYGFWLEVRNTYASLNGRQVKEYTKEQMLKWYNKLHTDSAEYKMWGNGLALPCALYVMEGIEEEGNETNNLSKK